MNNKETYDMLLKRSGLLDQDVLCAYMYGSRVYGNFRKNSDWDFVVVVKDGKKKNEQFSDNLINVNIYEQSEFLVNLENHEPAALECLFLDKQFILKKEINLPFRLDHSKLRNSYSAKSSNSWVKAKKKLTVEKDYNDLVGKKSLWHSLRLVDFGTQIAIMGVIYDYASCNHFYDEVMFCSDWEEMYGKYKKLYNEMLTKFRKYAPK